MASSSFSTELPGFPAQSASTCGNGSGQIFGPGLREANATDHELSRQLPVVIGLDLVMDSPPGSRIGEERGQYLLAFETWCAVVRHNLAISGRRAWKVGIATRTVPG